jgi:hypothetical protein
MSSSRWNRTTTPHGKSQREIGCSGGLHIGAKVEQDQPESVEPNNDSMAFVAIGDLAIGREAPGGDRWWRSRGEA